MTTAYRWRTLIVAMIGYGMVQMGLVPVTVIMPTLQDALGVPLRTASWVLTGYLLIMTAFILPAGRLGDRYGHRRVFLWGMAMYTATSAAGGLADSFWPLLILRLAQGMASAFVAGTAMAWVSNAFPASHRGRVVGAVTLSSFIGGFAGIAVATWAVQNATWHWVFFVLAPLGIIALALGWSIPEPARARRALPPMDWAGVIVLGLALAAFSLGLNHVHEGTESWADGWEWHVPMHIAFVVLAALFLYIERRAADPIMPLHFFRNRTFVAALGANLVLHFAMMGNNGTMPFLIETGMALTPSHTAAVIIVLQVLSLILSPVSGWLYDKTDSRILLPGGMGLLAIGFLLFGVFTTELNFNSLMGLAVYMGIGMGLFLSANNAALMSSVPAELRGFASGMLETTRQLGHGVATTVVGTLLSLGVSMANSGASRQVLQQGFRFTYWIMALVGIAGVGFTVWYVRERMRAPRAPEEALAASD